MSPKSKKTRLSRSTRAGIVFPVSRIHNQLKSAPTAVKRVTQCASVYVASVVEYLVGMFTIKVKSSVKL